MPAPSPSPGLGTLLRYLLELLDGDLERIYRESGLNYRPRYTPVLRVLIGAGPSSIQDIAAEALTTHSAASQTVSQMVKDGLVCIESGQDGRQRIVHLTPLTKKMLPKLRRQWAATALAASELNAELSAPLDQILIEAVDALKRRPFAQRIAQAAAPSDAAGVHRKTANA